MDSRQRMSAEIGLRPEFAAQEQGEKDKKTRGLQLCKSHNFSYKGGHFMHGF